MEQKSIIKGPLNDTTLKLDRFKKNRLIALLKAWNWWMIFAFVVFIVALPIILICTLLGIQSTTSHDTNWWLIWIDVAVACAAFNCAIIYFIRSYFIKNHVRDLLIFLPESFFEELAFNRLSIAKSTNKKPQLGFFTTRLMIEFLEVYDPYDDKTNIAGKGWQKKAPSK